MTDGNSPENLSKFLESDDPATVMMGLEMARGVGVEENVLPLILRLGLLSENNLIVSSAKAVFEDWVEAPKKGYVKTILQGNRDAIQEIDESFRDELVSLFIDAIVEEIEEDKFNKSIRALELVGLSGSAYHIPVVVSQLAKAMTLYSADEADFPWSSLDKVVEELGDFKALKETVADEELCALIFQMLDLAEKCSEPDLPLNLLPEDKLRDRYLSILSELGNACTETLKSVLGKANETGWEGHLLVISMAIEAAAVIEDGETTVDKELINLIFDLWRTPGRIWDEHSIVYAINLLIPLPQELETEEIFDALEAPLRWDYDKDQTASSPFVSDAYVDTYMINSLAECNNLTTLVRLSKYSLGRATEDHQANELFIGDADENSDWEVTTHEGKAPEIFEKVRENISPEVIEIVKEAIEVRKEHLLKRLQAKAKHDDLEPPRDLASDFVDPHRVIEDLQDLLEEIAS